MTVKVFEPEIKAAASDGTASITIARMGVVDLDQDVTLPGALGRQNVVLLPAHNMEHVPLGKGTIREVGDEVVADVKFNLAIGAARDWHAAIKFDFENPPSLQQYSYGYRVANGGSRPGEFEGRRVRFLQPLADGSPGVIVHEVSPVLLGAGIGTRTAGVKSDRATGLPSSLVARSMGHIDAYKASEAESAREFQRLADRFTRGEVRREYDKFHYAVMADLARRQRSHYYSEARDPAPDIVAAAYAVRRICAAELGVAVPRLVWIAPESDFEKCYEMHHGVRDWPYLVHPVAVRAAWQEAMSTMFVRNDLGWHGTAKVVAHEMRHAAGGDEVEAEAFERVWAKRTSGGVVR